MDRANLESFLAETVRLQEIEMNRQERSRDEIRTVLDTEFKWSGLSMNLVLDGIMAEMR